MKKVIQSLICILLVLTVFLPVGAIVSALFGYDFKLCSFSAFAAAIAALSVCAVVLDAVFKTNIENKILRVTAALLTPLSLINTMFYIVACPRIWVIASLLISTGCCCYLTIRRGGPFAFKIVTLTLAGVMAIPISFFSFIALFFGNFGANTVVQTLESPGGKYRAEVVDSDQGALGGNTHVNVYENACVDLILFKIEKKPLEVYYGSWGEYEDMEIRWNNDVRLTINSVEYDIERNGMPVDKSENG